MVHPREKIRAVWLHTPNSHYTTPAGRPLRQRRGLWFWAEPLASSVTILSGDAFLPALRSRARRAAPNTTLGE